MTVSIDPASLFIASLGLQSARQGLNNFNTRAVGMTSPDMYPAKSSMEELASAAIARAANIAPNSSPLNIINKEYIPVEGEPVDLNKAASVGKILSKDGTKEASVININPNIDRSYYAHELGHAVAQKTKIGNFINKAKKSIRDNPKLSRAAMFGIMGAVPAVAAGLQEGDDDVAGSIALAAAIASPTLVDEALASKNALAIMNDAGMRATAGQRGRLAGAYMSYLAPVLLAGGLGTTAGNLADDYTAIYDL